MIKSFFINQLGLGKIPVSEQASLESEGICFVNEGISGSITYYHFKSGGKSFSRKKQGFIGSLIITGKRLIGFGFSKRIINIPLDHPRFQELHFQMDRSNALSIVYDAHLINPSQTGTVEIKFRLSTLKGLGDLLDIDTAE